MYSIARPTPKVSAEQQFLFLMPDGTYEWCPVEWTYPVNHSTPFDGLYFFGPSYLGWEACAHDNWDGGIWVHPDENPGPGRLMPRSALGPGAVGWLMWLGFTQLEAESLASDKPCNKCGHLELFHDWEYMVCRAGEDGYSSADRCGCRG